MLDVLEELPAWSGKRTRLAGFAVTAAAEAIVLFLLAGNITSDQPLD
jgi:hypothetical protein